MKHVREKPRGTAHFRSARAFACGMSDHEESSFRHVAELIRDIGAAFLTSLAPGRNPIGLHARPMYTLKVDPETFNGELWFFTDPDSVKAHEIESDGRVMLTYADGGRSRYVCAFGRASVVRDVEKAKALWNIHARAWWPDGPESPDLVLLRVRIHEAEYWDGPGRVSYMLSLLKAIATHERIETKSGQFGEIRM